MNLENLYDKLGTFLVNHDIEIIKNAMHDIETEIITNGKVNKGIKSAFKRLLKQNDFREGIRQVYSTQDGFYALTNGYFLVDYGKDRNHVPKELHTYIDIVDCPKSTLDYEHTKLNESENIKTCVVNVEHLEKLHKYNKINFEDLIPYKIENTYVNPTYFLDVLTLMGLKNIKTVSIRKSESAISPIEIVWDETKAILLPIRVDDKEKEYYDAKNVEILNT